MYVYFRYAFKLPDRLQWPYLKNLKTAQNVHVNALLYWKLLSKNTAVHNAQIPMSPYNKYLI